MGFSSWKKQSKESASTTNDIVINKFLNDCEKYPYVYQSKDRKVDLCDWYQENEGNIKENLGRHGAVLFRNFNINTQEDFSRYCDLAIKEKASYVEGATPRKNLGSGVYTSTEFPEDQEIFLHNELSYVVTPPESLVFCCVVEPGSGGQTQLADMEEVLSRVPKDIVEEFEARGGWMLRRNYIKGFGPTIQKAFGSDNMEEIKSYCERAKVEIDIRSEEHVVTSQKRDVIHSHPVSGKKLWFNHMVFWHHSSLCPKVLSHMKTLMPIEDFPYSTYFADGSEIPNDMVAQVRQCYWDSEKKFDWRKGDVLLLDNWQVAHGRKPFSGERKVLVSMGAF